ncbi:MAG: hypothetical protein WBD22_11845 [Pyrinomonadaceae bacterium]
MSNDNKLEKRLPAVIKEKGQYLLAFGVVSSMLLVAGFPTFVIFFFAVFAYFLWKVFSSGSRNEAREIFEFYFSANEMLRDDDRRWFGFELNEAASRGEMLLKTMHSAPPLLHFTLGALYNKIGNHKAAIDHLAPLIEGEGINEAYYAYATPELRNYVRILRKIEREPAEAPMTSAAVRALERARKYRGPAILEDSRTKWGVEVKSESVPNENRTFPFAETSAAIQRFPDTTEATYAGDVSALAQPRFQDDVPDPKARPRNRKKIRSDDPFANRKPISEVLHDIYDRNVQ